MLLRRLLLTVAVAGITSIAVAQKIPVVKAWSPGDANGDGQINAADVFHLLNHIFGGTAPVGSGDVNADGVVNAADVIYLLSYLFGNGPAPK